MGRDELSDVAGDGFTPVEVDTPWQRFRKKPVEVRAYQFTQAMIEAHLFDKVPLPEGVMLGRSSYHPERREIHSSRFFVRTMLGDSATVVATDWVLPEPVADRFYPVNADVFERTYDPLPAAGPFAHGNGSQKGKEG